MTDSFEWHLVKEELPPNSDTVKGSNPVILLAWEFGQPPMIAIARCHQGRPAPNPALWIFDRHVYNLNRDWYVAEVARLWAEIPMPSQELIDKANDL